MEDFWKLETSGTSNDCDTNDEVEAYAVFQEYVSNKKNQCYVGWPWKCENPNLHDNYFLALRRLKSLHKTFIHSVMSTAKLFLQKMGDLKLD